jgi:hypothetical protein
MRTARVWQKLMAEADGIGMSGTSRSWYTSEAASDNKDTSWQLRGVW